MPMHQDLEFPPDGLKVVPDVEDKQESTRACETPHFPSCQPAETARSRCCRKTASGTLPTNWTLSLMTVFGTPRTPYRLAWSGYSLTSTTSATTCMLASAILWTSLPTSCRRGG